MTKFRYFIPITQILLFITLFGCQISVKEGDQTSPVIDVWYGVEQTFGHIGNTQRQINILGNINTDKKGIEAYYILNESANKVDLTLGSDLHRLARKGDFNIDIERSKLNEGENRILIEAIQKDIILDKECITVFYSSKNKWSLPYQINWDKVENIQEVTEIIDGDWEITDSGVRTNYMYYDRILAFGDSSWRNYEVETSVVFHNFTPPVKGPPTYNVSHVAIASRWPGHDKDNLQPNRKWHPLGATSEFRITDEYDSCRWRIFDGENFYKEESPEHYRKIQTGVMYKMKHRVKDISNTETLYSVKFWESSNIEPVEWDFQAVEINEVRETGSALLIAHNTDVTFGDVRVVPVVIK
ncbi:hypothetical protein ACFLU5_08635 [Bacteroidota bacterium]